jgi:hypothetical protein
MMPAERKKVVAKAPAMPTPTEWWVEVVPHAKDGRTHRMGPFASERTAERCESGVERNLNHEQFYTRVTSGPAGKP